MDLAADLLYSGELRSCAYLLLRRHLSILALAEQSIREAGLSLFLSLSLAIRHSGRQRKPPRTRAELCRLDGLARARNEKVKCIEPLPKRLSRACVYAYPSSLLCSNPGMPMEGGGRREEESGLRISERQAEGNGRIR